MMSSAEGSLTAVHCFAACATIWRVWETSLSAVHSLSGSARTLRDCPTALTNVEADWARDCTDRIWLGVREAMSSLEGCANTCICCASCLPVVHCLAASASICRGCEMALVAVHCLVAWASTSIDSCTDLRNVPDDWARVCRDRACITDLVDVYSLAASPRSCIGWEIALEAVHSLNVWAWMFRDS